MDYLEQELAKIETKIVETGELVEELGEVAAKELEELKRRRDELKRIIEGEPAESQSFNSVILEVRPGVGGEEAKIWAEDLQRMYNRFAEFNSFSVSQLDSGVIKIKGKESWEKFLMLEIGKPRFFSLFFFLKRKVKSDNNGGGNGQQAQNVGHASHGLVPPEKPEL